MSPADLAELLSNPATALRLAPREAAAMLAQLEGLSAVLRVAAAAQVPSGERLLDAADRLLTVQEAAERLGMTAKMVYRRHRKWPFTRHPSPGTLRFSERGLECWMARNTR